MYPRWTIFSISIIMAFESQHKDRSIWCKYNTCKYNKKKMFLMQLVVVGSSKSLLSSVIYFRQSNYKNIILFLFEYIFESRYCRKTVPKHQKSFAVMTAFSLEDFTHTFYSRLLFAKNLTCKILTLAGSEKIFQLSWDDCRFFIGKQDGKCMQEARGKSNKNEENVQVRF